MKKETQLAMILGTVRFCFVIGAMTALLYFNATSFDATELRSIFGVALVAAAGESVSAVLQGK